MGKSAEGQVLPLPPSRLSAECIVAVKVLRKEPLSGSQKFRGWVPRSPLTSLVTLGQICFTGPGFSVLLTKTVMIMITLRVTVKINMRSCL